MPELRCVKVDDTYILRDGAAGLFLAASKFPKNRETRAPFVHELKAHREAIDPKYHFIVDGPVKDNNGLPVQVRFSRKTKEQYLMTEDENAKPTGWTAFYDGGKWTVNLPQVKAAAKPKK
jgi:DNA topoisomerase-1